MWKIINCSKWIFKPTLAVLALCVIGGVSYEIYLAHSRSQWPVASPMPGTWQSSESSDDDLARFEEAGFTLLTSLRSDAKHSGYPKGAMILVSNAWPMLENEAGTSGDFALRWSERLFGVERIPPLVESGHIVSPKYSTIFNTWRFETRDGLQWYMVTGFPQGPGKLAVLALSGNRLFEDLNEMVTTGHLSELEDFFFALVHD